jgi:HEAT repeat protein
MDRTKRQRWLLGALLLILVGVLAVQIPRTLEKLRGSVPPLKLDTVADCQATLGSEFADHRKAAATKLGEGGPEATEAVPDLARLLTEEEDPNVLAEAAWALRQLGPAGVEALCSELTSPDWHRRQHALFLLADVEVDEGAELVAQRLCATLREDPLEDLRAAAAGSLSRLGVRSEEVTSALREAQGDDSTQVRERATQALTALNDSGG